ncbi:hypothetical protein TrST_g11991 [Triparma strigata]|uniref:BSD domain-containing protein n=1 Tax=Triparma strigata TaxID=1606541 RepID=A0A9W7E555_9STRA|nr:hypothetical protein TrST_g11991 [Triparma strigata]
MWGALTKDLGDFVSTLAEEVQGPIDPNVSGENIDDYDDYSGDTGLSLESRVASCALAITKAKSTYLEPLSSEYDLVEAEEIIGFCESFSADEKTSSIEEILLDESSPVKALMEEFVPEQVSYQDFWSRYYFRVASLSEVDEAGIERVEMIKHRINSEFDAKLVEGITNLFGGVKNRLKEVGGNVTKAVESVVDNVTAGIDNPEQLNNPDESVESTTIEFGSPSPKAARRDELDKIRTSHAVALSAKQLEIDALKERLLKGQEADEGGSSEEATELQKQLEQKDGVIESMKEQIALQQRQLEQAGAQITSLAGKEERSALEDERRNGALMELEKKLGVREEEVRSLKLQLQQGVTQTPDGALAEMEKNLRDSGDVAKELKVELASEHTQQAELKSQLASQQAEASAQLSSLSSQVSSLSSENSNLSSLNASLTKELDAARKVSSSLELQVSDLSGQKDAFMKRQKELESEIQNVPPPTPPSDLTSLTSEIETWKLRAQKCRDDRTQVVLEKKSLSENVQTLKASLTASQNQVTSLNATVESQKARIKALEISDVKSEGSSGIMVNSSESLENIKKKEVEEEEEEGWGEWGED